MLEEYIESSALIQTDQQMSKEKNKPSETEKTIYQTDKTHRHHDRWLDVCDAMPDMCFILSDKGILLEANKKGHAIINGAIGTSSNAGFTSLLLPECRTAFKEKLNQCLKDNSSSQMEAEFIHSDKLLNVELYLSRFSLDKGASKKGCLVVARDISERKRQELDLLRFTNLAHYTVNPIEITDPEGKITYVNPAFERVSGYTSDEVIGKNPNIFSSRKHHPSFWQKMWQTISSGKVWVGEVENNRCNGEPFYTQLLISPIINNNQEIVGYFGIHRDLSDKKYLEQQLIHAQKMESIGMLAAGLAHEVGNPLASISSLVQVIQRTSEDEFIQDKLELIKSQIARISRIIRDLVDFSRRSTYEVQLTDVNKTIYDAVEIIKVSKKAKDILFNITLDDNLPLLPLVPDQIEQVFINLLLNAADALQDQQQRTSSGTKIRQKIITVSSTINDDSLLVTVEDNGKGIRQDDLPKIFEPFYTTKKVGEGTGLGLWVSYGIIKSFQGEIKVKSAEGIATTFTIRLPVQT